MYWNDTETDQDNSISDDVIDLVYTIRCKMLPVDHAWPLSEALLEYLPWLKKEDCAGIHPIHISEEANGWMRPDNPDDILHLSQRTRLILRVPKNREDDARTLVGTKMDIAGNSMEIIAVNRKLLSAITTVFSRYIVSEDDEEVFMNGVVKSLSEINIQPDKMLPGKKRMIRTPDGNIETRSLMLTDISVQESIRLQQKGLGPYRHLGCGLFVPHKDILAVSPELF
ncbi:MAG: hypothetical protein BMS9Abin33_1265 [Gammaproteobacteria bacterium]|nr:MAG: hypothetical protein BMS9Abin33_1265 [Gammaproteobacteria bacterium]